MYNRYIPQSDGSYRRSQVQDSSTGGPRPPQPRPEPCPPQQPECAPDPEPECRTEPSQPKNPSRQRCPRQSGPPPRQSSRPPRQESHQEHSDSFLGIGNFLRQLLPKDFETEDLLVIILLLLMSGNGSEDQNTALLTLALYLFM